jgi:hypothetical protein
VWRFHQAGLIFQKIIIPAVGVLIHLHASIGLGEALGLFDPIAPNE